MRCISCRSPSPRRRPDGRIMEWGCGCIQARDEIMVKAWCAWCVCDGALAVGYCWLLYTRRRWLGALVDLLGSWTDLTFQDWQTGRRLAGMTTSGCPVTDVGTAPIARVPSAGPQGRQKTTPPDRGSQRVQGCIWAPAALGAWEAPAKESRHRVTVCPSCPPVPCSVFAVVKPATPLLLPGPQGGEGRGWSQESGRDRRRKGDRRSSR